MCDVLQSKAGIQHLVTSQKQLWGPWHRTNPREAASLPKVNHQRMGSALYPPVLIAAHKGVSAGNARYLQLSSLWYRDAALQGCKDGFLGCLCFWFYFTTMMNMCHLWSRNAPDRRAGPVRESMCRHPQWGMWSKPFSLLPKNIELKFSLVCFWVLPTAGFGFTSEVRDRSTEGI